ncbi:MAG TPA: DUF4838 domain-containing protein [Chthoniobacteraceae bacterium]|nr:DUF4838 domain-containing protein [Chthoniobacteraceae bacterium]
MMRSFLLLPAFAAILLPGPLRAAESLPEDLLDEMDQQAVKATTAALTLIAPDAPPPVILVAPDASASVRYAAEELAAHLQKMTGRKLEMTTSGKAEQGRPFIAVGPGALEGGPAAPEGVEASLIEVRPEGVFILGGAEPPITGPDGTTCLRDRGTLYGVYDFLENLGVRWYRPEPWGWHLPQLERVELPLGRREGKTPGFEGRTAIRIGPRWDGATPESLRQLEDWASRQRLNIQTSKEPRYGGWLGVNLGHAHARLVSPSRYLAKHPEYFALVHGKRGNPGSGRLPQLCLGNPELQQVFAEAVLQAAKEKPYELCIATDPEDGTHPDRRMCACELCKAMDDPARPEVMSNRVFAFTNLVARRVAQENPKVQLGLYAYSMHTEVPTRVEKIEPNVLVGLANINSQWSDWSKPLADPQAPGNAAFLRLIRDWKGVLQSPPWIREYSTYGWPGPMPMTRLLQDRVRTYRAMGVKGLIWPGEQSFGPQLPLLYFKARLQWDPDLDLEKELALFYENYYGPAREPMAAYHQVWMEALENSHLGGTGPETGVSSGGRGMHLLCTPALIAKLSPLIDEAQAKVKGKAPYEQRLRGTAAGFETARRVGAILQAKLGDGETTPVPHLPEHRYLKSDAAQRLWEEFTAWLGEQNRRELTVEFRQKEGQPTATTLLYLKRDLLENGRFRSLAPDERTLLERSGFNQPIATP